MYFTLQANFRRRRGAFFGGGAFQRELHVHISTNPAEYFWMLNVTTTNTIPQVCVHFKHLVQRA